MFSFFSNPAPAAEETKNDCFNSNHEACLKLFAPGPIITLYNDMIAYIQKNGNQSPKSAYLSDDLALTVNAWTGTPTKQLFAIAIKATIEKYMDADDLKELLTMKDEDLVAGKKFKAAIFKDVYLVVRQLPKILKEMPAESITIPYLKEGSTVRKSLTTAINYYKDALIQNNYPSDLDIHAETTSKLALVMKKF